MATSAAPVNALQRIDASFTTNHLIGPAATELALAAMLIWRDPAGHKAITPLT